MSEFQTREERGIHVHVMPTKKYKLNTIVATMTQELKEETATGLALLPFVMMRGSEGYPTPAKLQLALDELYGASLVGVIDKKGERHVVDFTMTVPNQKYLKTTDDLFSKALSILSDVMLRPLTKDGGFLPEYVAAEKEQHRKRLNAVIDDKIAYARERCLAEMTKGEPYAIPRLGRAEQLEEWDGRKLYELYRRVLKTAPMHIYVIGDVEVDEVAMQIFQAFDMPRETQDAFAPVKVEHGTRPVQEVVEEMNVNQGKLNIGLWTDVGYASDEYPALVVANGIFGMFPHSKLFVNVREKNSLAYYCSSRQDAFKGLLYVQAGVEVANFDKARSIIVEQLEEMKKGNISEQEMSFTINGLINSYKTSMDTPTSVADIHINGLIAGRVRTSEEIMEAIRSVTADDVVRVVQKWRVDTVYMLKGESADA
jgi:predicted Zn-dependent peptidase